MTVSPFQTNTKKFNYTNTNTNKIVMKKKLE